MVFIIFFILMYCCIVAMWEIFYIIWAPIRDKFASRFERHKNKRKSRQQLLVQRGTIHQKRLQEKLLNDRRERLSKVASERRTRTLQNLSRKLQLALHDIPTAPDFQRAAVLSEQCASLPPHFRRRQFVRFKRVIVDHYRRRLQAGTNDKDLHTSLAKLLQSLGIAAFEADYIQDFVKAQSEANQSASERLSVADEMKAEKTRHELRMTAIDNLARSESVKEELTELEERRHDEAMRRFLGGPGTTDANVVEI